MFHKGQGVGSEFLKLRDRKDTLRPRNCVPQLDDSYAWQEYCDASGRRTDIEELD